MSNKYTETLAKNINKRTSRGKIAINIRDDKKTKVIHYLGGKTRNTPFEKFFKIGVRTTFIRYEFQGTPPIPYDYLNETDFEAKSHIEPVLRLVESRGLNWQAKGLMKLQKELEYIHGCFVNGNIFHNYQKYMDKFPDHPHYFWLDFCSAPTPELIEKTMDIVVSDKVKEVYATFYMNHRGNPSIQGIIEKSKVTQKHNKMAMKLLNKLREIAQSYNDDDMFKSVKERLNKLGCDENNDGSLNTRANNLKAYCDKMLDDRFECNVFDTYYNGKSPMCVLKFNRKEAIQFKKKCVRDYVDVSKNMSNKDIAILWNVPIVKVAGLAAAAKRMKLK